jgi:hypothetical protein
MDDNTPAEDVAYWKEKAMSDQVQKSYYESKAAKLKQKLMKAEGELQDIKCDLLHTKHINEFLRLVIADK